MFPPRVDLPVIGRRPLAVGTWVTGHNVRGLFGFPDHQGHLFVISEKARHVEFSNSGYVQDAKCLVCRCTFKRIDGEFLQKPVCRQDIERCLEMVKMERDRMRRVAQQMMNELAVDPS